MIPFILEIIISKVIVYFILFFIQNNAKRLLALVGVKLSIHSHEGYYPIYGNSYPHL